MDRLELTIRKLHTGYPYPIRCCFALGYPPRGDMSRRLFGHIKSITVCNGLETDLKINEDVFDIEFELI